MLQESFTFTLDKPREQVFKTLTDLERFSKAADGKVTLERVPGKPATGVGETFRIKSSYPGAEEILCETTEWEPPRRCTRRFDIKDLPTVVSFILDEAPEGTRMTVDVRMEAKSLMYRMLLPVPGRKIKAEKERAVAMLQERLDVS